MENRHIEETKTILREALGEHHPRIAIASSFSPEDNVLIDLALGINPACRVFAIDTGRLNEETYETAEAIRHRYSLRIEWVFPRAESVQALERERGLFSFKESIAARHECCGIRKVEPLSRALAGLDAWITGMRQGQSITRASLAGIETDSAHGGITKYNPLTLWTAQHIADYIETHRLPVNALVGKGYPSIGCAPCTRAVAPGEDIRAGRWWWESPDHKECGLHLK